MKKYIVLVIVLVLVGCTSQGSNREQTAEKVVGYLVSVPYACLPNMDEYKPDVVSENIASFSEGSDYMIAYNDCLYGMFDGNLSMSRDEFPASKFANDPGVYNIQGYDESYKIESSKFTINCSDKNILEFEAMIKSESGNAKTLRVEFNLKMAQIKSIM